jgi:type III restriction enzyme
VILDSDWEAEFCRVAESHPKVLAYVKNHNLGLEVPYRFGSVMRKYLPDFVVLVDDGHGPADPLHLVVEIKGYRGEDAIEKKSTMDTYWVPGVNHLGNMAAGRSPSSPRCTRSRLISKPRSTPNSTY